MSFWCQMSVTAELCCSFKKLQNSWRLKETPTVLWEYHHYYLFFRFSFSFPYQQPEKIHFRFFTKFRLLANGQKGRWPQRCQYVSSLHCSLYMRVLSRFFGTRNFPYLKLGIRDLKAKSGKIRDWKYGRELECPKEPSGLRDYTKFWVGNTGLKNPIRDPLYISECGFPRSSDFYVRKHTRKFYARK